MIICAAQDLGFLVRVRHATRSCAAASQLRVFRSSPDSLMTVSSHLSRSRTLLLVLKSLPSISFLAISSADIRAT